MVTNLFARIRAAKSRIIVKTIAGAKNKKLAKWRIAALIAWPILLIALIVNWLSAVYANIVVSTILNIIIGAVFIKLVFELETLELISKEIEKKPD